METGASTDVISTWPPTAVRFVLAGGAAATVNFISRMLLSVYLPYAPAIVLAFLIGMATAFLLNRRFVFRWATSSLHHQVFWFVTVNLFALLQTLGVSLLLFDFVLPNLGATWHAETIAHAVGIVIPIFTSYLSHKRVTFR
jgi:putative flippase GtrA